MLRLMGVIGFAAEHLRLPYLSAYLNSIGTNFRHGANFATGGSTIRRQNETIFEYGISPFSLDIQILHIDQFKSRTGDLYSEGSRFLIYPQCFGTEIFGHECVGRHLMCVGLTCIVFYQHALNWSNHVSIFFAAMSNYLRPGAILGGHGQFLVWPGAILGGQEANSNSLWPY